MKKKKEIKNFDQLLQENKSRILDTWFDNIINIYPDDTARFLKQQEDQFANPVGNTLRKELENIFEELTADKSSDNLYQYLDAIIRVRAVQDFTPSSATGIFLMLKEIIRREMQDTQGEYNLQIRGFEDKIDQLMLVAFDVYMKCREKIWELKTREAQDRTKNLLRKRADVEWNTNDQKESSND